jgi:outer membrane protein assembly factor BamB
VRALDAATGDVVWEFATGKTVDSSVAVGTDAVYALSRDGNCYGIDRATGSERWRKTVGSGGLPIQQSSPKLVGGSLYVGVVSDDPDFLALDPSDGSEKWAYNLAPYGGVGATAAVVGDTVYVPGRTDTLHALRTSDGTSRWIREIGPSYSSPAVVDGVVYVGCAALSGPKVFAFDADTGDEQWSATPSDEAVHGGPSVADGTVVVPSLDHNVHAYDAATGAKRWTYETGEKVYASPAIADGVVYVGSYDDRFHAIDLADGSGLWTKQVGNADPPAAVAGETVYAVGDAGVYAFQAP